MTSGPSVPTTIYRLCNITPQTNALTITIAFPPHLRIRHSARTLHLNNQETRVGNAATGGGRQSWTFCSVCIAHVFVFPLRVPHPPPPLFPKARRRRHLQSHARTTGAFVLGVGLVRDSLRVKHPTAGAAGERAGSAARHATPSHDRAGHLGYTSGERARS
jgi:hypothetical protein